MCAFAWAHCGSKQLPALIAVLVSGSDLCTTTNLRVAQVLFVGIISFYGKMNHTPSGKVNFQPEFQYAVFRKVVAVF